MMTKIEWILNDLGRDGGGQWVLPKYNIKLSKNKKKIKVTTGGILIIFIYKPCISVSFRYSSSHT